MEKLSANGIDIDCVVERFSGNLEIYEKYLYRFQNDTHMDYIKEAMEEKDYQKVLEHAHAMKGVTGTLGMNELYQKCSEVVSLVRKEEMDSLPEAVEQMNMAYQKIMHIYE